MARERKKPTGRPRRKLDGMQEAQLAAIAWSVPPEGAERWTLALLADKLVELEIVDSISSTGSTPVHTSGMQPPRSLARAARWAHQQLDLVWDGQVGQVLRVLEGYRGKGGR